MLPLDHFACQACSRLNDPVFLGSQLVKDVKSLGDPNIISPMLTQMETSVDTIVYS
jgi:hypothetical protein